MSVLKMLHQVRRATRLLRHHLVAIFCIFGLSLVEASYSKYLQTALLLFSFLAKTCHRGPAVAALAFSSWCNAGDKAQWTVLCMTANVLYSAAPE